MTSLGGKLTAVACHPKNVNKADLSTKHRLNPKDFYDEAYANIDCKNFCAYHRLFFAPISSSNDTAGFKSNI